VRWSLPLLLAVCGLRLAAAGGEGPKGDLKKLQGVWRPVKLERAGQTVADGALPGARFVVAGNALLFKVGDQTLLDVRFALKPGPTPAAIDLTSEAGTSRETTLCGIYRLEGNQLTLCWPLGADQRRPATFAEKGKDVATLTLEREHGPAAERGLK
jgi:uncharacterized protein (TIGR03067 family)